MGPVVAGIVIVVILIMFSMAVKVVNEYERGVIFRLGRLLGAKGPGLFFIIPFLDRMVKIDLRVVTMDVPAQDVITRDNVTVRVNAVVYFRVINPEAAVVKVINYIQATSQISQTTLRNVLGQHELDELLSQREKLNQNLQSIIDEQTDPWGIKVSIVEIKDVELPEPMRRSMAAQAEAERVRRAKIIHAEGELQASQKLSEAGHIIAQEPVTLQLRYLQTLTEIATEKTNTLVFPIPIDLISMFIPKERLQEYSEIMEKKKPAK
jgi:regulator of protease activity HflC (stomatin/prohibitin superfamily)